MSTHKINNTCNQLTVIPPKPPTIVLKADTGASKNYIKPSDMHILSNIENTKHGPQVNLPDGSTMNTVGKGVLPLNAFLSKIAQTGNILEGLSNSSLLSIGQLCDDNCIAVFSKLKLKIYKNEKLLLTGIRNWTDGLWDVVVPQFEQNINMIVRKDKTKMELAEYLHKCAFSPALSTFQKAIRKGHFITWPGIHEINFEKHISNIVPTAKGHLDQERSNLQTTKKQINSDEHMDEDYFPIIGNGVKTYENAAMVYPMEPKMLTYSDQTGRFPHRSSRGNEYIMIMYDYDSNAILCAPLKNRQAKTITEAWTYLHDKLTKHGHETKNFILDNECSNDLKMALKKNNKTYELTPPNMHRRNAAERAIRTFKNHCMAGFASCDPAFPLSEWDRLLVQAEITLNLLRTSRVNPALSAYTYLFGNYDFNKTPLAPPGTKVLIHKKSNTRGSWDYHGVEGWYVGPSQEHYRCLKCFNPETFSEVDTDTLKLIPNITPIPVYTDFDVVKQAVADILHVLKNSSKNNIPSVLKGNEIHNAFRQISMLLGNEVAQDLPVVENKEKNPMTNIPPKPRVTQATSSKPRVDPPDKRPAQNNIEMTPLPHNYRTVTPEPSEVPKNEGLSLMDFLRTRVQVPPRLTPRAPFPKINFKHTEQPFPHLLAQHIFDEAGKKQSLDDLLSGPDEKIWKRSIGNELGRLSDGIPGRVRGTKAVRWIHKKEIPKNKKVTYANMVCDYRPLKEEKYRVRLTIGGDKLEYNNETASPTANLVDTKILINSTISDAHKGARFMSVDIKDCFLMTPLPLDDREYMRINAKYFDEEFKTIHKLHNKVNKDGYVYCEIQLGMYGLKQAAILSYNLIKQRLGPSGYYPIKESNGLWKHKTRRTIFALTVDDFGVKYFCEDDAKHFLNALQKFYDISIDRDGTNYCGLTFKWNYKEGYVDVSMPGYVSKALARFNHTKPTRFQHAPHRWNRPIYGRTVQYAEKEDKSPKLDAKGKKLVQKIVGTFLYYGRALETPSLVALNDIGSQQASPTENTLKDTEWLMDFLAHHPNATIRIFAGTMQLAVDSDASYLVAPGAKSRYAGHFYLEANPHPANYNKAPNNAAIHTECRTLRNVVCSAAEAECGGLFHNAQVAVSIRRILEAINHPQKATRIKTDNKTANSFVHASMRAKRSKTWDMRYHWLREQTTKKTLAIYWDKGTNNDGDYFTKHHSPMVHRTQRPRFILKGFLVQQLVSKLKHNNFPARVCSTVM